MKILDAGKDGKRLLLGYAEAIGYCKLSQGPSTCSYLAKGPDGYECLYKNKKIKPEIDKRRKEGSLISLWSGCRWSITKKKEVQ